MKKLIRLLFVAPLILIVLTSCALPFTSSPTETVLATPTLVSTALELSVQADASALTAVGQIIKYTYTVKNAGVSAMTGSVAVTGAVCPDLTSVGNMDANFDAGETFTCTSEYVVTQADLDKGAVVTTSAASVSGINSNEVVATVSKALPIVLTLSKTAAPATFNQAGEIITYTYVILNSGASTLGPDQFVVTDAAFSAPINCGNAAASLAATATLTCSAIYTITQADVDAGSVSTSATASGGGAVASSPASVTLTKGTLVSPTNSTLTAGSTIQHKVVSGEWVWQIARCYGADTAKVVQANSQLTDPGYIEPDTIITVPNIGSVGKIYGTPCVTTHTVQVGDTWQTIALKYNADVTVLQVVNKNILSVGQALIVPLNSVGVAPPVVE